LSEKEEIELKKLKVEILKTSSLKESEVAQIVEKEITTSLDKKLMNLEPEILDAELKAQLKKMFKLKA